MISEYQIKKKKNNLSIILYGMYVFYTGFFYCGDTVYLYVNKLYGGRCGIFEFPVRETICSGVNIDSRSILLYFYCFFFVFRAVRRLWQRRVSYKLLKRQLFFHVPVYIYVVLYLHIYAYVNAGLALYVSNPGRKFIRRSIMRTCAAHA